MSKTDKQLLRLLSMPKDFSWAELVVVMQKHHFELHSGSGSGRKFFHAKTQTVFFLHEPHPEKIVKRYALKIAITALKNAGEIK